MNMTKSTILAVLTLLIVGALHMASKYVVSTELDSVMAPTDRPFDKTTARTTVGPLAVAQTVDPAQRRGYRSDRQMVPNSSNIERIQTERNKRMGVKDDGCECELLTSYRLKTEYGINVADF